MAFGKENEKMKFLHAGDAIDKLGEELRTVAIGRIGVISAHLEEMDISAQEKAALGGQMAEIEGGLETLDSRGLEFVNGVLHQVLAMFIHFQGLEPISGLFLTLLKFLSGGQEHVREGEPGHNPYADGER